MSSLNQQIVIWNRQSRQEETEEVYGGEGVRWIYGTRLGLRIADWILTRSWVSQLCGVYKSSRWSARSIPSFIEQFQIPMQEFQEKTYQSFNDFFIREFKPGVRPFVSDPSGMPAFAEGRYLAYEEIKSGQTFPVKGRFLTAKGLLGDADLAKTFEGGPLLLARLCPTDYHRFHFPDSGNLKESYSIHGRLHSVNPLALKSKGDIFVTNERQISILETENFGNLAYIEIGALCVGKIVQTYNCQERFKRGAEKGYFLFGGSTVIVLGERGRWKPEQDLLDQTGRRRETFVKLGDQIASKLTE